MYESGQFPLYDLLNELDQLLEGKKFLSALLISAIIPDICAALSDKKGKTSKSKYIYWCKNNITENSIIDDYSLLYDFRCGFLHQGVFGGREDRKTNFIFSLPGAVNVQNCKFNGNPINSVEHFCRTIKGCSYVWCEKNKNTDPVYINSKSLVGYKEWHGFVGFTNADGSTSGLQVIA